MTRDVSLAHLTVLDLPPPAMIRVAARTGYTHVGLRLLAATPTTPGYPLMDDPALLRETRAALAENGIFVLDIEFVRITPEVDIAALEPFLAVGAELGARHVITAPYDPDHARLADRFGAITDLAGQYGIGAVLEFFPWADVPDLASAIRVVDAAGRAGAGILVDTLHFNCSGSTLAELDALPAARLPYVHVADAPVRARYTTEELLHAGRVERLPPGEGEIDLRGILAHLPPTIPMVLEVPMTVMTKAAGSEAVARRVRRAAESLLTG